MRRIVLSLTTAAGFVAPAPALAADAPPAAVPALGARVASCTTGAQATQRTVDFQGSMPAADGASVLSMRFTLERRVGSGAYKAVPLSGFGRWARSAPGAAGFVYSKRLERLKAGAGYRVVVRFKWTEADGTIVKRATRRSHACRQPDVRPDLGVLGVTAGAPDADGRVRYVVRVRNGGLSALLAATRVGLAVDGVALLAGPLGGLPVGAVREVAFDGPACAPGGRLRAMADPAGAVEEPDEGDNVLESVCS